MPDLSHLAKVKNPHAKPKNPLWAGPTAEGPLGGVTQSMLSRYLTCKERFRVQYVEGWHTADVFNSRLEFGSMWHCCEEHHARHSEAMSIDAADDPLLPAKWLMRLQDYCRGLSSKYKMDREAIQHWYEICAALFPLYTEHWQRHPDVVGRKPLLQETVFDVPYELASGRTVRLRGKWDSVDLIKSPVTVPGVKRKMGIWLQENKTKSSINEGLIRRTLSFDLQTMLYLIALQEWKEDYGGEQWKHPLMGVRYNVVRRAAHKSVGSMLKKIEDDREDNRIGEWFGRWEVTVGQKDIQRFRTQCLDPLLENLCDDYEWWESCYRTYGDVYRYQYRQKDFPAHQPHHYVTPFHYDPIVEGGGSDLDEYLATGSTLGLRRAEKLFEEL